MIHRTLILIATLLTAICLCVPAIARAYDPLNDTCSNAAAQSSTLCQGQGNGQNPLTGPNGLIRGIANIIAMLTGIAAVITIIVAGFRFITSGGDSSKVKSAKDAIVAALIGVAIVLLADIIISFVISRIP